MYSSIPVQNSLNSLQNDVSQQLETLLSKVNSQKEKMTELEETVQKVNSMYLAYAQKKIFVANTCFWSVMTIIFII